MTTLEEDLHALELKVKQLKLDYEQYFSGARPREPQHARGDVSKQIAFYLSTPIKNTALRFKFNSVNSRFQSYKRHWDNILRQIENGTYRRDVFRANLKQNRGTAAPKAAPPTSRPKEDLFDAYCRAAASCGQSVESLTRQKLAAVVTRQEEQIRARFGCNKVRFRVVVEQGRVKLKASAVR